MSHEDFNQELDALRENLPKTVEETVPSKPPSKTANQFYSVDKSKEICAYASQGKSLRWISLNVSEMPCYSTLQRWKIEIPEFAKMLRAVREARAAHFEEAAIDEADALEDPRMVGVAKTKIDTYWKAAEVNDPSTYGKKLEHKGQIASSVILQVVTGFGPPNKWQTPPKLKADGTIDKSYEDATPVASEVASASVHEETKAEPAKEAVPPGEKVNGPGDRAGSGSTVHEGNTGSSENPRPENAGHSSEHREPSGLPTLWPESGQPPAPGSAQSP